MAEYNMYTELETRKVIELKVPTTWVEVSKVLSRLAHETKEDTYDDAVIVTVGDESIYFTIRPTVKRLERGGTDD